MRCSENTFPIALAGTGATASRVFSATSPEWTVCCPHRWRRRPRSYSSFSCSARSSPAPGQGSSSSTSPWPLPAASAAVRPMAVIGSALFGTISGNSAANVVASGTFTIPMMIKVGYSPRFASAVEAVASTGGQMTPPILGAAAFIIAELTGHPVSRCGPRHSHPGDPLFRLDLLRIDLEAYKEGAALATPRTSCPTPAGCCWRGGIWSS